jgi:hypothetical protein
MSVDRNVRTRCAGHNPDTRVPSMVSRIEDLLVRGIGVDLLPYLERRMEGLALGAMGPVKSSIWPRTVRRHRWAEMVSLDIMFLNVLILILFL